MPMLIIHSENDLRCPINQAEELFVALRTLGRDVTFYRFPGENHELVAAARRSTAGCAPRSSSSSSPSVSPPADPPPPPGGQQISTSRIVRELHDFAYRNRRWAPSLIPVREIERERSKMLVEIFLLRGW